MNCHQCGTELFNSEIICPNCGATQVVQNNDTVELEMNTEPEVPVESEVEIATPIKSNKKKIKVIATSILAVLLISAGGFSTWAYFDAQNAKLLAQQKIKESQEAERIALEEAALLAAKEEEDARLLEETRAFEEAVKAEQERLQLIKRQIAQDKKKLPENCEDIKVCINSMLVSTTNLKLNSIEIAAARISQLNTIKQGNIQAAWELNQQGIAEAQKNNHLAAIGLFKKALIQDPASIAIHLNLVDALFEENLMEEAHQALLQIVAINPRLPYSWRQLARYYADKNKSDMAVAALIIAYQFAPDKNGMLIQYENVTNQSQVNINMKIIYLTAIKKIRTI